MELILLTPEQVMEYWSYIKECIGRSLPPSIELNDETLLNIQSSALIEDLQCWIAVEDVITKHTYGLMTTSIVIDPVAKTRNLLIFTVTITDAHPKDLWNYCLDRLAIYARNKKCSSILAYSNNERMLEIANSIGADCSYRLIQFLISKIERG